jgi:hypothetical protein
MFSFLNIKIKDLPMHRSIFISPQVVGVTTEPKKARGNQTGHLVIGMIILLEPRTNKTICQMLKYLAALAYIHKTTETC